MEPLTELLIFLVVLPVIWLVQHFYPPKQRAIEQAKDQCVACRSRDLTALADRVYRCNACGYEGGEGRALVERALREASFLEMAPARRLEEARRDLLEARSLALGGVGDLERANGFGDEVFNAESSTPSHDTARASGTGRLLEARSKIRNAAAKLGLAQPDQGPSFSYRSAPQSAPLIESEVDRERLRTLLGRFIGDDADARAPGIREGKAMVTASARAVKIIGRRGRSRSGV